MNKLRITPLSPVGEQPVDFYSWGDMSLVGLTSKKEQFDEKLGEAFGSIEIKEDTETPETDYVLKVLGRDAGRVIIPFETVIKDAYYDKDKKELVLIIRVSETEDKEIRISVADLIDTYEGDELTIHVENNVISLHENVINQIEELDNAIKEEERRAEITEKSLKESIDSEIERAKAAEKENAEAISKVEADYKEADETLKKELADELEEKTKNMVEWQYSSEDRKHIVLGNHENILGTSTEGGTYNIAMVSKWDVADFGSNQLHTNLNSKDGQVTINDDKVVATTEDISTEKERAEIAEQANAEAISKVEKDYKEADAKLEEELEEKTKNMVEWQYSTEDRKHIVLGNHENILGTSTEGGSYNLAMVSKWNVADFGSSSLPMNLNATDGKVTINDDKVVATTDDITNAIEGLASETYVDTAVSNENKRAELAEEELSDKIDKIELKKESDLLYALYVNGVKHGEINIPKDQFLKDITYDSTTKELVFTFETSEGEKVTRVAIGDLIDTYTAGEGLTLNDNVFSVDFDKVASVEYVDEKTNNMVKWEYSTEDRKHIVLDNHSNILGKSTEGGSYNLAMVSKWDVADFGSSQLHTNLNSKDGNVTINDDKVVATTEDVSTAVNSEKERAEIAEQANAEAISKIETDYKEADEKLEEELIEKTKNMVEWQYSTEDRKHIVLGNHENILGTSVDGGTYNLAMVSKWDVADFGSSQLHANLNSKDGQVTINDDKVVATVDDVNSSEERLQEKIDTKANKEHIHEISEVVNLQSTLDTKLNIEDVQAILKEQIYKLFNIDMIKAEEFVATEMNNPSEKYAIIGNGETITLTSTKSILAEELKMNDIDISSEANNKGLLSISANKVEIEDTNISGSWNRSIGGNTMVTVNNAQNVSLKDVTVSRTNGYNAVEVGLDGKGTSKTIIIDGLEITEKLSNNGINIFSFEDNADVVIKNCHFTEVSNPIRISNATYAKNVNITIKDCTFDKWESNSPAYAGLILLQDYTSKTKEEALEKKPFATFTITLDNVTGPYGKIDNTSTIEEICGSGIVDKQLVYVYADKAGLIPYDKDTFPTIIIK